MTDTENFGAFYSIFLSHVCDEVEKRIHIRNLMRQQQGESDRKAKKSISAGPNAKRISLREYESGKADGGGEWCMKCLQYGHTTKTPCIYYCACLKCSEPAQEQRHSTKFHDEHRRRIQATRISYRRSSSSSSASSTSAAPSSFIRTTNRPTSNNSTTDMSETNTASHSSSSSKRKDKRR